MSAPKDPTKNKSFQQLVDEVGLYPPEAYEFIQLGLSHTVQVIHGASVKASKLNRHVSGQQLCEGLRQFALSQYGFLARTVLRRWNITSTLDFGRIVFALVEVGHMKRQDQDTLDDFRDVFDFRRAFEAEYRIPVSF